MSFVQKIASGYRPNLEEFVQNFGHIFELLHQLGLTFQDSEWHREGDVFIHTQMVLENIYKIIDTEANLLDGEQKLALILSAVFHDIGKPLTTRENDTKRIIAPHHELRGCSYIAHKILELDLPYHVAQHVLNLVRYHHMPKLLVIRDSRKSDYFHLGRLVNVELLYYLAKADMLGVSVPINMNSSILLSFLKCSAKNMISGKKPTLMMNG